MKTINITFEDNEFEDLILAKGKDNWRNFVLKLLPKEKQKAQQKPKEDFDIDLPEVNTEGLW